MSRRRSITENYVMLLSSEYKRESIFYKNSVQKVQIQTQSNTFKQARLLRHNL